MTEIYLCLHTTHNPKRARENQEILKVTLYHIVCLAALAASAAFTGFITGYCLGYDRGSSEDDGPKRKD